MRARRSVILLVVLVIALGLPSLARAQEPAGAPPASFSRLAAAARAAAIMLLAPDGDESAGLDPADRLIALQERALGAGVIVDPAGFALTNARIVLLVPEFEIMSGDGAPLKATVLALDVKTDIAVLKLENDGRLFPYLRFGDSEEVRLGDRVIAVGAPYGLVATVTAGVITAKPAPASASPLRNFLQTDAVAGHGNAGAPVVNMQGELVGLCTLLGGDDVGHALPSRVVRRVYLELVEKGRVSRPWLGVTTQTLTADLARALGAPDVAGVLITDALPDGPAARAGVRSGDIVLQVDAAPVSSRAQLERAVNALEPDRAVVLTLRRENRVLRAPVTLAEEPDDWQLLPALARAERLLGVKVRPITPTMGAMAASIEPDSPADAVGMEPGDVIREIDRRPIRNIADFQAAARTLRPGAPALMLVQRGAVALYVVVTARK